MHRILIALIMYRNINSILFYLILTWYIFFTFLMCIFAQTITLLHFCWLWRIMLHFRNRSSGLWFWGLTYFKNLNQSWLSKISNHSGVQKNIIRISSFEFWKKSASFNLDKLLSSIFRIQAKHFGLKQWKSFALCTFCIFFFIDFSCFRNLIFKDLHVFNKVIFEHMYTQNQWINDY